MENALIRLPALRDGRDQDLLNGPESFTPDNNFILGEAPELQELLRRGRLQLDRHRVAAAAPGGRSPSGSCGGEPTLDLWPVDIRRFARFHGNDTLAAASASARCSACTT